MQGWIRGVSLVLAGFVALVGVGGTADAKPLRASYQFAVIADSTRDRFDPFSTGCAAINNREEVAFRVERLNGTPLVYRWTRGRLTLINILPQRFSFIGFNPSINDRSEVAFSANLEEGEAIFRGAGGALTTIVRTEPGPYNFVGSDVSLNDDGNVAFRAELDQDFDQGLFVGNGRRTRTIFRTSNTPFGGTFSGPAINNRGEIAFFEFPDAGGEAIYRTDGRTFTLIADNSGAVISQLGDVSINNRGIVAFDALLEAGGEAVYIGAGGALREIVNTETSPFAFLSFGGPAINDSNVVAFAASLDDESQGVFTGSDPVADRVIGTGDALAGSTVANVVFCREGLNDDGDVAFVAQLADERSVVVLGRKD
jgi:hypothetical protein